MYKVSPTFYRGDQICNYFQDKTDVHVFIIKARLHEKNRGCFVDFSRKKILVAQHIVDEWKLRNHTVEITEILLSPKKKFVK